MYRVIRWLSAVLLGGLIVIGPAACGKNPGKPNPELKVPDVPPGGHGARDDALKKKGQ
jgi:hypothetical protein